MTGVPANLAAPTDYMTVRPGLVRHVGGANEALVWTRIQFRTTPESRYAYEHDGELWWRATRGDLAAATGLGQETVRRTVERLERNGDIAAEKHMLSGRYDRTKSYRILLDALGTDAQDPRALTPNKARALTPNAPIEEVKNKTQEPPIAPQGAELELISLEEFASPSVEDMFEIVWQVYPKPQGRKAALSAFEKALKRIAFEDLLGKVEAWSWGASKVIEAGQTELRYLPNFSTWLNQDRWQDPIPTPTAPRRSGNAGGRGQTRDSELAQWLGVDGPQATHRKGIES